MTRVLTWLFAAFAVLAAGQATAQEGIDSRDIMGGSWGKVQELDVIKSGGIWYKKADIHSTEVNIINHTAILLSNITLLAVVGGNEVTNPFTVTEVYIKDKNGWSLGALSFTKLLAPVEKKQ